MKKVLKKLGTVVVAIMLVCSIHTIDANAATKSWSLRYVAHAQTSANVTNWSTRVITTKRTTTMSVSQVGGGATVFVYTDNGIGSLFSGAGSTSVPTVVGKTVYGSASYSNNGNSNNTPSGTFDY